MMKVKHLADLYVFLMFAPVFLRGETIQECIKRTTLHYNSGDEIIGSVHTEDNRIFNLYKSRNGLTWCESFMKCEEKSQQLAVVHDRSTQEFLFNNSLYNISSGHAWVAGRRKDFGTKWTWLSDDMKPSKNNWSSNCKGPGPTCRMTVSSGTVIMLPGALMLKSFICANSDPEKRIGTWYEAMNACADIQGRLAVYPEVVNTDGKFKYATNKVRSYWVGLYYKPWIWILGGNNNATYRPVYHSFWKNVSNAEQFSDGDRCLAVEGNSGKWVACPCQKSLNHFICQSTFADVIDISDKPQSTTTHQNVVTGKPEGRGKDTNDITPTKEVDIETTTRDNGIFDQWIVVIISAPVSVSVLSLLVSVCLLILVWKSKKKDTENTSANLVSLPHDDTLIKSKKKHSFSSPKAQDEYSFLRDSKIYSKQENLKPHLPPRDQTYNQPYEDSRLETESETEIETDLGKVVQQPKEEVDGVNTAFRMNTGYEIEEEYLNFIQDAQPENDGGSE